MKRNNEIENRPRTGDREGFRLTFLRTGRAVFPYTSLRCASTLSRPLPEGRPGETGDPPDIGGAPLRRHTSADGMRRLSDASVFSRGHPDRRPRAPSARGDRAVREGDHSRKAGGRSEAEARGERQVRGPQEPRRDPRLEVVALAKSARTQREAQGREDEPAGYNRLQNGGSRATSTSVGGHSIPRA